MAAYHPHQVPAHAQDAYGYYDPQAQALAQHQGQPLPTAPHQIPTPHLPYGFSAAPYQSINPALLHQHQHQPAPVPAPPIYGAQQQHPYYPVNGHGGYPSSGGPSNGHVYPQDGPAHLQAPAHSGPVTYGQRAYTADGSSPHEYDGQGQVQSDIGRWKTDTKEGPVKNACLSCRSKKAKCDGRMPVCGQCEKKALECVFVKSRRGGARKKREVAAPSALQEFLKKLDGLMGLHDPSLSPGHSEPIEDTTDIVRQFTSREEILSCYYNEVHPFLPVMPQRRHLSQVLASVMADSPFLLAAQTILVLVPHPLDPSPKSSNSKRLRSATSNALGHRTMQRVEALLAEGSSSLECVQALTMLSLWEWGNAGNQSKNRARAGQAIQVAMDMGLHEFDKHASTGGNGMSVEGDNWRADMARRTWYITYVAQLTAAIVSGNEPIVGPDDPRIRVDFPTCSVSDRAWPTWVNANRMCVRMFDMVNSVYYGQGTPNMLGTSSAAGSMEEHEEMARRVIEVDKQVLEMMREAERLSVIELVPGGEEEVVRNMQLSARLGLAVTHIHIHRQQAFPEVSLFSKRICGLPQAPDFSGQMAAAVGQDDAAPTSAAGAAADGTPQGVSQAMGPVASGSNPLDVGNALLSDVEDEPYGHADVIDEMWQPETFPENLPAPWFAHAGGAAALYAPTDNVPTHIPALTAYITPVVSPGAGAGAGANVAAGGASASAGMNGRGASPSLSGASAPASASASGAPARGADSTPHQAWGVDANDNPTVSSPSNALEIFPPGISLARCATAAHTIVRLEVLHRSAAMALWSGPPKWLPFCACGLVSGAYAFLLLALAVQAENTFGASRAEQDEVDKLLTNVKVILAGLEAYGTMWAGIDVMAGEVRAALEAATRLPNEVRAQIESASTVGSAPATSPPPPPPYSGSGPASALSHPQHQSRAQAHGGYDAPDGSGYVYAHHASVSPPTMSQQSSGQGYTDPAAAAAGKGSAMQAVQYAQSQNQQAGMLPVQYVHQGLDGYAVGNGNGTVDPNMLMRP